MSTAALLTPTASHSRRSLSASLLVTALGLLLLAAFWRPAVQALLPLQAWALQSFTNDFTVRSLTLQRQGLDQAVQAELALGPFIEDAAGRQLRLPPNATLTTSVSAAKVLLPLACVLVVLVLWPVADRREFWVRAVLGTLCGIVLVMIDFPTVLLGLSWATLHDALPGLGSRHSEWIARFLESGGRLCLGLSAGLATVSLARWLVDGWPEVVSA
jgi:hypothetical protein